MSIKEKFDAVIFDMDGILVNSEPFWRQAEIEIFGEVGVWMDDAKCRETMGMRIDEVVALRFAQNPWEGPTQKAVSDRIVDRVIELVEQQGAPMDGVVESVRFFSRDLKMGVASSSPLPLIEAVLRKLQLAQQFDGVCSADTEALGKPHPGVYLKAAESLGCPPERCLAIEDSVNGVIAAKAAKMACVAVPEAVLFDDPRFGIADWKLRSLREIPGLAPLTKA